MRVLVDMNLSSKWVDFLRQEGHEVVHWAQLGVASAPDEEIIEYARVQRWVVLTNDLDFGIMLASSGEEDPMVVQLRSDDLRVGSIGEAVLIVLRQIEEAQVSALATVEPKRTRVRLLPFPRRNSAT